MISLDLIGNWGKWGRGIWPKTMNLRYYVFSWLSRNEGVFIIYKGVAM